jgi:hypothetical protein
MRNYKHIELRLVVEDELGFHDVSSRLSEAVLQGDHRMEVIEREMELLESRMRHIKEKAATRKDVSR